MNYLLDTHIFLWSLFSPDKLSGRVVKELVETDNTLHVSAVTFWEIALKFSLGKLDLEGIGPDELPAFADRMGLEGCELTAGDAASFHHLPRRSHKDPFDRMIVWQAIRHQLILISKGSRISEYRELGLTVIS